MAFSPFQLEDSGCHSHRHFSYISSHILSVNTCTLITHMSSSPNTGSTAKSSRPGLFAHGRHPPARNPHAASHATMPVQARQHLLCLNHSSSSQGAPHPPLRYASSRVRPCPPPPNFGLALTREGFQCFHSGSASSRQSQHQWLVWSVCNQSIFPGQFCGLQANCLWPSTQPAILFDSLVNPGVFS